MKKFFLSFFACAGLFSSLFAQSWGFYASALYIKIGNNASAFYDVTTTGNGAQNISGDPGGHYFSSINSDASLNGPIKLEGAEIKTYKNGGANVCSPVLHYTVYQGSRPASPTWQNVTLNFIQDCSGGAFTTGGPCGVGDQKWQVTGLDEVITPTFGTYTLEFYFEIPGGSSGGCSSFVYDSNGGSNYATNVTVSTLLPVTFTSFKAQAQNAGVQLAWSTGTEVNVSHFEVLRSGDGNNFISIVKIVAENKSAGASYNFTDKQPLNGKNFYRIKCVDKDGKTTLSNINDVSVAGTPVSVSPNPAHNYVNVYGAAGATFTILSQDGKVVKTTLIAAQSQRVDFILPANTYFIKVSGNNKNYTTKIVVQ